MKSKLEKLNDLYKSRFGKPLIFFGLYFIFFAVIFSLGGPSNNVNNNKLNENMWNNITNNYEYLYEINENANMPIILHGKKYNNKHYFTKIIQGEIDSEFYSFYNVLETKVEDGWVPAEDMVLVSDTFDNRFLDIGYIKMIIADSELMKSENNFDDSKSDFYKYGITDIEVISVGSLLKKIIVMNPLYTYTFQYKNINNVKDFVVER